MLEMFVAQPGLVVPAYRVSQRVSVVLAVLVLHMTVVAADCVQPVVPLAIKNITLSDGNVRRGVSAKVGTPPKELAFQPLWYDGISCYLEKCTHKVAGVLTIRSFLARTAPKATSSRQRQLAKLSVVAHSTPTTPVPMCRFPTLLRPDQRGGRILPINSTPILCYCRTMPF